MIYIIPQIYVCPKCGEEMAYTPSVAAPSPILDGRPICPRCYMEFISANVPVMEYKEQAEKE